MRSGLRLLITLLLLVVSAGWGGAEEWGDLRGQVVFDGDPRRPRKLTITKDQEECCKHDLVDESLTVNPIRSWTQNVAIYLYPARTRRRPSIRAIPHGAAEREFDNHACRFDPRVVLLWTRQTLVLGNSDPIGHNALIDTQKNPPVNVTHSGRAVRWRKSFRDGGAIAGTRVLFHPPRCGWLLIRDHPYMTLTDARGLFEIRDLPAVTWEFVFWHERAKFLTDVMVSGQREDSAATRYAPELTIQSGDVDLGVI